MKIQKVSLLTKKITEMKEFYTTVLDCPLIEDTANQFTIKIGWTELTFVETTLEKEPFYHYAINIPRNKMKEAKAWALSRLTLNKEDGDDEVFFESWNAHAIYFEDPSGNIIEYIARQNLNNDSEQVFSTESLECISEVGIVVDEVISFVRQLNELGFPNWQKDSDGLTPVGDEYGLFIIVKYERRWYFSNQNAAFYPVDVTVEGIGKLSFMEKNKVHMVR